MIPRYRAWKKSGKELGRVGQITFELDGSVSHVLFKGKFLDFNVPINEIELMQSTDMVDRNGNIIFEGDIVKMAKDVYSEPTYYEVVRHRGGAYRLESKQHGCELWLRHTDCEVVGNVYENRELLEDKE